MIRVQNLITAIRARRKELGVPEKEQVGILIVADAGSSVGSTKPEINNVYRGNEHLILRLARVSAVEYKDLQYLEGTRNLGWVSAFGPEIAVVYERQIDISAERERLTKELARLDKQISANEARLADPKFTDKAPAHIVEGLRKQTADLRILRDKAQGGLDALPPA